MFSYAPAESPAGTSFWRARFFSAIPRSFFSPLPFSLYAPLMLPSSFFLPFFLFSLSSRIEESPLVCSLLPFRKFPSPRPQLQPLPPLLFVNSTNIHSFAVYFSSRWLAKRTSFLDINRSKLFPSFRTNDPSSLWRNLFRRKFSKRWGVGGRLFFPNRRTSNYQQIRNGPWDRAEHPRCPTTSLFTPRSSVRAQSVIAAKTNDTPPRCPLVGRSPRNATRNISRDPSQSSLRGES